MRQGTSARWAMVFAKGCLKQEDDFIHESFIGSKFTGRNRRKSEINGNLQSFKQSRLGQKCMATIRSFWTMMIHMCQDFQVI